LVGYSLGDTREEEFTKFVLLQREQACKIPTINQLNQYTLKITIMWWLKMFSPNNLISSKLLVI
jgi:hypothetical protein